MKAAVTLLLSLLLCLLPQHRCDPQPGTGQQHEDQGQLMVETLQREVREAEADPRRRRNNIEKKRKRKQKRRQNALKKKSKKSKPNPKPNKPSNGKKQGGRKRNRKINKKFGGRRKKINK